MGQLVKLFLQAAFAHNMPDTGQAQMRQESVCFEAVCPGRGREHWQLLTENLSTLEKLLSLLKQRLGNLVHTGFARISCFSLLP